MANRYAARSSYFGESGYTMSPGLKRARAPYFVRNTLTGAALVAFVAAVYTYSISAVKQDDFSDLPEVSPVAGREGIKTIEEELLAKSSARPRGIGAISGIGSSPQGQGGRISSTSAPTPPQLPQASPQPTALSSAGPPPLSVAAVPSVNPSIPSSSTRQSSMLIVGAPDVDRLGRVGDTAVSDATAKRLV